MMPIMAFLMVLFLMFQLQSFSKLALVMLTAPLGLIGVSLFLLLFNQPFGFVSLLGVIALAGMIMRNSVILVDQIDQDIAAGHTAWDAVIDATVRRARPILLTAGTAIFAMIPLSRSVFWGPMAVALMGGLLVATALVVATAEQLQLGSNDVHGVLLDAGFLVGVLAVLQPTLDVDRLALGHVLASDLGQALVEGDAVPLGVFDHLAGVAILAAGGCGDADVGHGLAYAGEQGAPCLGERGPVFEHHEAGDHPALGRNRRAAVFGQLVFGLRVMADRLGSVAAIEHLST